MNQLGRQLLYALLGGVLWLTVGCSNGGRAQGSATATPPLDTVPLLPVSARAYEVGNPTLRDVWVDPVNGSDDNDGTAEARAFQSIARAWASLPADVLQDTGYRLRLMPGRYGTAYLESRHGTAEFPILIEPAREPNSVTFEDTLSFFDSSYVYLQDFQIIVPGGDAFHCERCNHLLLRRMTIASQRMEGQTETVKLNQSQAVFVEQSDISGAGDNAVDFVGVQYGHLLNNRIHDATDWCLYLKGGSAYFVVDSNEIYNCGTGGFTAGQGTGFQFMVPPWLHYEAYDIKVTNNILHHTDGACLGANGAYNLLLAYNTCYRVGARSHLLEVVHGRRGCDGNDAAACQPYINGGGWGTTGEEQQYIPNRNVFIYNNLFYNPAGTQSQYQHLEVRGAVEPPPGSNVPSPALGDQNLQIRGNVIWNGPAEHPLGIEATEQGCQPSNPTCNATQLQAENAINTLEPQLINPEGNDFRPTDGSNLGSVLTYAIPDFTWGDAPTLPAVPQGSLSNTVATDYIGAPRTTPSVPGAFVSSGRAANDRASLPTLLPPSACDARCKVR